MNGYLVISDHGKVKPAYEPLALSKAEADLWAQVGGKPRTSAPPSTQLQDEWGKRQASLARSERLGDQLFREVAGAFGKVPTNCQPLTREG